MAEILYKELSFAIIGAAMEIHKTLGPGFLEAIYKNAMIYELMTRGMKVEIEKPLPVNYKGQLLGEYFADLVVADQIILELKAISSIAKAHEAQAMHYLAATGLKLAIIINFGAPSLQYKRIVK
jgi:GxxExxY protein